MRLLSSTHRAASAMVLLTIATACGAPGTTEPDDSGAGGSGQGAQPGSGSASSVGGSASGGQSATIDPPVCEDGTCEGSVSLCANSVSGWPVLRRLTVREFKAVVTAAFPGLEGSWSSSLSPDSVSQAGFDNQSDLLLVTKQLARELDSTGASIGAAVGSKLSSLLPCSNAAADRACAGEFISKYGAKLFRRPVEGAESEKYLTFFDSARKDTDFPTAISWVTRALLHATPTLYRHELGQVAGDYRTLSQYEIASALSFTFTEGPPSDELMAKAASGELSSAEALKAEAQKLATSPAGRAAFHRFFESVFEYTHVSSVTRPKVQNFSELRAQMVKETQKYIESVAMNGSGTVSDLLTAPVTFPTAGLSTLYGFPTPSSDYAEVQRPEGRGIGILAQGSVLAGLAAPEASSPTKRGLLVHEKLLCRDHKEVPPDVPPIPNAQPGQVTTRQRYEELHALGPCAECHAAFDPIGFGFEDFDEGGRYRADDSGLTIDSSGVIPQTNPGVPFSGQEELAQGLAQMPEVGQCLSAELKTYVFGSSEACLGESGRKAFARSEVGFVDYWTSLAAEPHFTRRRAR